MTPIYATPAQMLGDGRRIDARDQSLELRQVCGVERVGGTQRQADTVQCDGIVGADRFERGQRRSPIHEIVLAVGFEPADRWPFGNHSRNVRGAQADARDMGQECDRRHGMSTRPVAGYGAPRPATGRCDDYDFGAVSLPPTFSQEPFSTYFQSMGSISALD